MTPDELAGCLRMLEAYYPGDWPLERQAVWAEQFAHLNHHDAIAGLKAMASSERFPTVAAFSAAVGPGGNASAVIAKGDRRFSPGIGWLGGQPEPLELEQGHDAVVVSMATAREALRRAKESA